MLRFHSFFLTPLLLTLVVASGCSDDPAAPKEKLFTLVAGSATVSLKPGGSTTTYVKASRTPGFGGIITFGVGNVSTPLNVGMMTTAAADSVRLDVSATAAAAGNYSFEVFGTASNGSTERLTIPVNVAP